MKKKDLMEPVVIGNGTMIRMVNNKNVTVGIMSEMYNVFKCNDNNLSYTVLFENGIRERNSNYSEDKEVDEQIAEEARILYVALTRSIRNCIWINNIDSTPQISWGSLLEG